MKLKKKIGITMSCLSIMMLCACKGYSAVDGIHENYQGTWQRNQKSKVEVEEKEVWLHNICVVNPIWINPKNNEEEVVVEDMLILSTLTDWPVNYDGDKKTAFFESNGNVICYEDVEVKGAWVSYGERWNVKFSGFISAKTHELAIDNAIGMYYKI